MFLKVRHMLLDFVWTSKDSKQISIYCDRKQGSHITVNMWSCEAKNVIRKMWNKPASEQVRLCGFVVLLTSQTTASKNGKKTGSCQKCQQSNLANSVTHVRRTVNLLCLRWEWNLQWVSYEEKYVWSIFLLILKKKTISTPGWLRTENCSTMTYIKNYKYEVTKAKFP